MIDTVILLESNYRTLVSAPHLVCLQLSPYLTRLQGVQRCVKIVMTRDQDFL